MNPAERLEGMEEVIADLVEAAATIPILVEGDRDETSLRRLGIAENVVRLNQGIPVHAVCEALAKRHREVIVLTDWDRKGGQLARLVREALLANGVRPNVEFRRRLATLAHVRTVEGLAGWMETLAERAAEPARTGSSGENGP